MTTPSNFPSDLAGDNSDFRKAKKDSFGATRLQYRTVTVADSASAGTTYAIVPFTKGYRMSYGSQFYVSDLDTGTTVTLDIGYVYKTGSSETDDVDAFASGVTTAQTGGLITFDEEEGLSWVAADDGYIQVRIAAGPVTTAGTIEAQVLGCYDGLDSAN